jgi:hypothetical protein
MQEIKIINKKIEEIKSDTKKPFHVNEELKLLPKNIRETKKKKQR